MAGALSVRCGQLLVVGLAGVAMAERERRVFADGHRGGVILFDNNNADPRQIATLIAAVRGASPGDLPPLVSVDQEGGRFVNVGPPLLRLPPMQRLGALGDDAFAERVADAHARELSALGFTMSFAPVADVDTRPENPIIGDRAFAWTPDAVLRFAAAWARGLERGGLLSCAKHFPGHGDTTVDSHLALPFVDRDRAGLEAVELAPFRGLATLVPSMMTAHVVYPALDPDAPATLSHAICTRLLRRELGFTGVLFSDAMEMKAIRRPMGEAAVAAVAAGCDVLLVCATFESGEEAHAALVREAETSPAFRARVDEAFERALAMRLRVRPAPDEAALGRALAASAPLAEELRARLGAAAG